MSRETRQLLLTVLLAVVALWVLGRVRYPERPPPNPVPALLTQLGPRLPFDELAAESTRLRNRLGESVLPVRSPEGPVAAVRIADDTAIALLAAGVPRRVSLTPGAAILDGTPRDDSESWDGPAVIASDAATGLAVLRVQAAANVVAPALWMPRALDEPRYLLATVASADAVALRPAFVGAMRPVTTPAWSAAIWAIPPAPDLQAGSLVFTPEAELAGLVVTHGDGLAIVPGATLFADAQRVRQLPARPPGSLGIQVQTLTPALAAATGARRGVVVAWVDRKGPAADQLIPGDVIEAADGGWVETRAHWDVRAARLAVSDRIVLGVRRRGDWRDVQLQAAALPADVPLGLTLRRVTDGSEVIEVARASAAEAAGVEPGDVITLAGTYRAPTPAQVRDAFQAGTEQNPVLVAIARGTSSRIMALHR